MLTWLWLLIALILFGVAGFLGAGEPTDCGSGDACGPDLVVEWTPVTIDGHEGVVLPVESAPDLLAPYGLAAGAEDVWAPSEADLQAAEDELVQHVSRTPGLGADMLDARRQYAGFVENGERKIFVNGFCAEFDDWRSSVVFVMDGGSCFWQAVYNLDTGTIEWLSVNGEA